jgi:MYXO-CTERM domain-containing protein
VDCQTPHNPSKTAALVSSNMTLRLLLSTPLAAALALAPTLAQAFRPVDDAHAELVLADGAPARAHLRTADAVPAGHAAWAAFEAAVGPGWRVIYDLDRQAPLRVWGPGVDAPDAMTSPEAAARFAQALLRDHVALLAPGAAATDFVLASNVLRGEVRSVGFTQRHRGLSVEGGQVSFRFKHGRLVAMGSEAWPHLDVAKPAVAVSGPVAARAALKWIRDAVGVEGQVESVSAPFIHAVMRADGGQAARAVLRVMVRTRAPAGLYAVDVDLATGAPFAHRQTLRFLSGQLNLRVPLRYPGNGEIDLPAALTDVVVNGASARTAADGTVTWMEGATATVTVSAKGAGATVTNDAGINAVATFSFTDGATKVWDAKDSEFTHAQVVTYVAAQEAREYVRRVAPGLAFLNDAVIATVNIDDECNAFSDGTTINFFRSSQMCENTGRLSDVVHHEYGHSVHAHAIIAGVGAFDGALSEGMSDYLAATYANDAAMGRGFFRSAEPLRDLNPEGREWRWPDDQGESHQTGQIIGGAMWDLRTALVEKYGEADGVMRADRYWYAALERASDILSVYPELLVEDDDDGDLANGTPNLCLITSIFRDHGLTDGTDAGLSIGALTRRRFQLQLPLTSRGLCPGFDVEGVKVTWGRRGAVDVGGVLDMVNFDGIYAVDIPPQPEGEVLQYSVEVGLSNGERIRFPDNAADPMYEAFIGEVRPIYCTDFEEDPLAAGWTSEMLQGSGRRPRNEWEWGEPQANGSGDPSRAFSGRNVVGNDLGLNSFGTYQRDKIEEMVSPVIDASGATKVRLQYRRWLTVEDGAADQAEILAGDGRVWVNKAGDGELHHLDKEWRFHDVDLTDVAAARAGQVQVTFRLTSDAGLSFGGWTLDDFCVVAWDGPLAACGDGRLDFGEACDDGNDVAEDGCEADCSVTVPPTPAACGDGTVDEGEQCDDGNLDSGDGCEATCVPTPRTLDPGPSLEDGKSGCGCSATEMPGASSAAWALGLALFAWARRRR